LHLTFLSASGGQFYFIEERWIDAYGALSRFHAANSNLVTQKTIAVVAPLSGRSTLARPWQDSAFSSARQP
jgi:hypothetical protein